MFYLISEWEQNGMTIGDFCRSQNIPKSTFGYWHKKYKEQRATTSPSFIPVKIKNDNLPGDQFPGMSISFPNGVQINLKGHADINFLRELIHIF